MKACSFCILVSEFSEISPNSELCDPLSYLTPFHGLQLFQLGFKLSSLLVSRTSLLAIRSISFIAALNNRICYLLTDSLSMLHLL